MWHPEKLAGWNGCLVALDLCPFGCRAEDISVKRPAENTGSNAVQKSLGNGLFEGGKRERTAGVPGVYGTSVVGGARPNLDLSGMGGKSGAKGTGASGVVYRESEGYRVRNGFLQRVVLPVRVLQLTHVYHSRWWSQQIGFFSMKTISVFSRSTVKNGHP